MRRFVSPLRLALALFAAAVSTAAPVLAHARVALLIVSGYGEVCTDGGVKRIPGAPTGGGEQPSVERSHCVTCLAPAGAQAPGGTSKRPLASGCDDRPVRLTSKAGTPVEPVRAAPPRGPPEFDRCV
jgi:hypothetical protein